MMELVYKVPMNVNSEWRRVGEFRREREKEVKRGGRRRG